MTAEFLSKLEWWVCGYVITWSLESIQEVETIIHWTWIKRLLCPRLNIVELFVNPLGSDVGVTFYAGIL